jgi:hypothetical protein
MKLVRLRRPKAACSLSYVDYRPKTNAGHTKGRPLTGGIGQGKETNNLNEDHMLTIQE